MDIIISHIVSFRFQNYRKIHHMISLETVPDPSIRRFLLSSRLKRRWIK